MRCEEQAQSTKWDGSNHFLYMLYACNVCDLMSICWIKVLTLVSLNQVVCFVNPASYFTKETTHQL